MRRIRLCLALLLVLAMTACAPQARTGSGTASSKNASQQSAAAPAQTDQAQKPPMRVVMGKPLPGQPPVPKPLAPQPQPQAASPAPPAQTPGLPMTPPQTPGLPAPPAQDAARAASPAQTPAVPMTPPQDSGLAVQPAQLAGPAAPTGFGGLAWGASANSTPGLATYEADKASGVVTCVWPQGPKDVAGAPIREAYYEFFQDRFYHVWIDYDGMAAYKTALAGLTREYGPPTEEKPDQYYHSWSLGDVNIYCAYHPSENEGDVSFFYQPLYEPMMAARKAAAAKHPARSRAK